MTDVHPDDAAANVVTARHSRHVVVAALVPPLGVHLAGARPRDFWIATALTILAFVPGAVFALYLIMRRGAPAAA